MRIDMHLHTCYSPDCNLSLAVIINTVTAGILDAVAITDHNEIGGAVELKRIAPFPVIVGEEISTVEGEIIGYFLQSKIKPGMSVQKTIEQIKEQGGLVAVPHPFDRLRKSVISKKSLENNAKHIDLIEIYNSRTFIWKDNLMAGVFANNNNIAKIAGSDAHTRAEIARSFINIEPFSGAAEFMVCINRATLFARKSPFFVHLETKARKIVRRFGKEQINW